MARPRKGDFDWKDIVNGLRGPFPETGIEAPMIESVPESKEIKGVNPNLVGNFSRVSMDIYFFLDPTTNKYYSMQNQRMSDLGEMTLAEAAEIVNKAKRRR